MKCMMNIMVIRTNCHVAVIAVNGLIGIQLRCINGYYTFVCLLAAFLSFGQSRYIINENEGSVELLLILSNQLQYTITIQVFDATGLASRKHIPINYYSK